MKNAIYVLLLFLIFLGMFGCGGGGVNLEDDGEETVDASSSGNVIHPWNGQTLGLVKVYVRHAYKGGNKKVASYVAKGSGLLFLQKDGHYEVVTARHLVFPDIGLKSLKVKKKTIEFDSVAEAESTVVVGPISVKPERFLYLQDSNLDIARLEIEKGSNEKALLFGIQNPNINGYFQESPDLEKSLKVGDKVSAYGFPGEGSAAPSAQIKELQVASMRVMATRKTSGSVRTPMRQMKNFTQFSFDFRPIALIATSGTQGCAIREFRFPRFLWQT